MECGPANCPLGVTLSPAELRATKKQRAQNLYKQGFMAEQIASMLNVGRTTVYRYLDDFSHNGKIKRPVKTATNPQGAGRPKGKRDSRARQANGSPDDEIAQPGQADYRSRSEDQNVEYLAACAIKSVIHHARVWGISQKKALSVLLEKVKAAMEV